MNRFVKTLSLLIMGLTALSAGVDATLDRLASAPQDNQLAIYDANGKLLAVFTGTLPELEQVQAVDGPLCPLPRRVKIATVETNYRWL